MTEDNARTVANVIVAAAALGATYYVLKTPALRRLAWQLAVTGVTLTLPAWVSTEVRRAWAESGRRAL
jgi:hypothetical protein